MATPPLRIGELLLSQRAITEKQLQIALDQQKVTGAILGDLLVKLGFITAENFAKAIAVHSGIDFLNLRENTPEEEALQLFSKDACELSGFIPLHFSQDGRLAIGIINPSNIVAIDIVLKKTGKQPKVYLVDRDQYQETLEKSYFFITHPIQQRMASLISTIKQTTGTIPGNIVSELVDLIIMHGIRMQATDIHITPSDDVTTVFYRLDGVLQYGHCFQKLAHAGITSRIKVLSELDITEQRLPQDGSFTHTFLSKQFEMRVSTVPTVFGENVVLRLLSGSGPLLQLESLGLSPQSIQGVRRLFRKSHGIILMSGPTGSGKTTTLYAALRELNRLERNILTVEDPVEYKLSFVKQTQVNDKAGYNFALATRSFMRQDPDVMLIGEIRDEETAQMAVRASITGHLVLSTLHTNDAATAIPRLLDLKVDTFLLSSALTAVLAQRLVRKLCSHCRTSYQLSKEELNLFKHYGIHCSQGWSSTGCSKCNQTGYTGRISICEVLTISPRIRQMIFEGASSNSIAETAAKEGMHTLLQDGLMKAAEGVTSIAEVWRVAG